MNVDIIEIESGEVVATYPVLVRGLHDEASDEEYFAAAWRGAVEDDMVDADKKDEYSFRLAP